VAVLYAERLADVPGITFGDNLQPDQLTRLTEGVIALVKGTISGNGRIDWNSSGKVTSTGDFTTNGIDLAAPFGPVTGMRGTIHFNDLLGLTTAPGQLMTVGSINPGILVENGVIRSTPTRQLIYTMADPPNLLGATQCLDMLGVMSLLQAGRVDLGFLGAAEVDRFGNLNSTQVVGPHGVTRLPGSGGACDIASLAKRFVVLLEHSKARLPERVSYVTSPGFGTGSNWRQEVGLVRGGPSAVITTKAVLRFDSDGEAFVSSLHPGVSVEEVVESTGWAVRVSDAVAATPEPSEHELRAIRDYDKEGFWTS
jgi:glutaconate CoA-transferase subunit B